MSIGDDVADDECKDNVLKDEVTFFAFCDRLLQDNLADYSIFLQPSTRIYFENRSFSSSGTSFFKIGNRLDAKI